jgi:hypothetical protein
VLRGFVDYTLKQGETVREVIVISGNVRIEGTVDRDLVVTAGNVTIASTGVVEVRSSCLAATPRLKREAWSDTASRSSAVPLDAPQTSSSAESR